MQNPPDTIALLEDLAAKRAETLDSGRPAAVAKQRARQALTARERVSLLFDEGSFTELGQLVTSIKPEVTAPADGVITGIGKVDGVACAVMAYDYTVWGGSQGAAGHAKLQRLAEVIDRLNCPLIMIMEGGGARAQDVDHLGVLADGAHLARMSGRVPLIGLALGRVFAGHANMIGLCDVIIARRDACLGIAGPPLVADALGLKVTPEEIGPAELHAAVGAVDLLVDTDEEAIAAAKTYLGLVTRDAVEPPEVGPVEALRNIVPTNSRRVYDIRPLVALVADPDSALELRPAFARNITTTLLRIGGKACGVVANQPMQQAGIIDGPAADKAARFIQLCDRFDLPLIFLIDTPGFFMGPDAEKQALIRHSSRMLLAVAHFRGPMISVVIRKAYGTAYWVMGSLGQAPSLHVVWPTAEFGNMNLTGAATLAGGADPEEIARIQAHLRRMGTAAGLASRGLVDDVIDPADTRAVIARMLSYDQPRKPRVHPGFMDPW